MTKRSLNNTSQADAQKKSKVELVGNTDIWQLICKASCDEEGWMKSTKAMQAGTSVIVQVTTEHRNKAGECASAAEALQVVQNAQIKKKDGKLFIGTFSSIGF